MTTRAGALLLAAISIAFGAVGCGDSPVSPTDVTGLATEGPSVTVLPTSAAVAPMGASGASARRVRVSAIPTDPVTVTVTQVPSISVTVNPGETATITGLPPGSYTLVFTQSGEVVGTQEVTGVQPGEQIQITAVFENGAFVFVVIIIGNPPTPPPPPPACSIDKPRVGESVQIEGNVASGNASAFQLDRKGDHPAVVDVDASGATYRCVGQAKGSCQANLMPGAQVHVRGTVASCSGNSLLITASEVKVQKP